MAYCLEISLAWCLNYTFFLFFYCYYYLRCFDFSLLLLSHTHASFFFFLYKDIFGTLVSLFIRSFVTWTSCSAISILYVVKELGPFEQKARIPPTGLKLAPIKPTYLTRK